MSPVDLLAELTAQPGPPGQEKAVREVLVHHLDDMGYAHSVDAKGNLLVPLCPNPPKVIVTAHLDEIAMMVTGIRGDGSLMVSSLGGLFPWKLGEGPVQILAPLGPVDGVLSFGSIHTESKRSVVTQATVRAIEWEMAQVVTGRSADELIDHGVRPGTRVVVASSRRALTSAGPLVAGYFLDDRADLVSWLLALEALQGKSLDVMFAATAAEEVGGEGALFLLQRYRPDVCVALELGPNVPDAPVELTDEPTVWVTDSYSSLSADDLELVAQLGRKLGMRLQYQALSRGGSDASCAASHGLCGRPFTFGLPMENSHGFEIMHPGAMAQLARLTVGLLEELCGSL